MLERISYSKGFPKECGSSQRTELATAADNLISRQAAIDAFWQLDIEIRPLAINAIKNMLMSLPPAQQWIPCSERLPKKSGDYLVTVAHHSGELWVEVDQFDNENGSWWHYMDDVTAWMPRPKPYKEIK